MLGSRSLGLLWRDVRALSFHFSIPKPQTQNSQTHRILGLEFRVESFGVWGLEFGILLYRAYTGSNLWNSMHWLFQFSPRATLHKTMQKWGPTIGCRSRSSIETSRGERSNPHKPKPRVRGEAPAEAPGNQLCCVRSTDAYPWLNFICHRIVSLTSSETFFFVDEWSLKLPSSAQACDVGRGLDSP